MVNQLFKTGNALFTRQQTHILSAAAVITASSFLSSIFGLIKTRLLLQHFSATPQLKATLDAYWVALRLPEFIFQLLIIGALSAAFIPVFSKYWQKNPREAYHISSSVMNLILLIFTFLSSVIFIFARQFNDAITSIQFTSQQLTLATNLTRIMLLAQLFFAVSNFLTGIIQAQQRFLIPALSPIAYNLGIIAGILFLTPFVGIYAAAIGVVFGAFLHLLLQLPLALKLGFTYHPIIDLKHPGVKDMSRLMPPRTLAISVSQLELSSLVYFATALSAGSLTILQISQQLLLAPIRMFSVPIGQASLPFLAKETASGKLDEFKRTFLNSFHQILYLTLPAGMLLLILRIPLVRIIYGSRQFPWATTLITGKTVAILSLALFAHGIIHLLVRAFYALHNTKTPFLIALVSFIINLLLAFLAVFRLNLGILGLAASLTISTLIQAFLLLLSLNRQLGGLGLKHLFWSPAKMLFATIVMGLFLWLPMRLLDQFVFDTTRVLNLLSLTAIVSFIGLAVYLSLSFLLKIEELTVFLSLLKRLGNWQQVLEASEEVIEPTSEAPKLKPS
ncbi:MAG: murein biosynthesis integral membrane protein MurJ [Candidatus Chisholmbacteria bacterium]|nr:murein biosynthesis integral membrane protein MurJ [Candidatus Chisholmbacteria bacterium]